MTYAVILVQFRVIISIHMPHTWHDSKPWLGLSYGSYFNPHATYVA